MTNVKFSTDLSILIQIITGIIGIQGIFLNLTDKHIILKEILTLEMIVQFVELFFYVFFLRKLSTTGLQKMTIMRYFDWIITTPTMLLTTIVFYKYEENLEKNIDEKMNLLKFIKEHKNNIINIFICNFFMLLFGFLGEIGMIDMVSSLTLGFLFFIMTFYNIYINYAIHSQNAMKLFYFIFIVWGLYGIAALMSPVTKNNMFNVLDIFAKNFFGLYLYYRIKQISLRN
jgi:bacteriorhodopsin